MTKDVTEYPQGESGNKKGRPKGALNKATEYKLAVQSAMEEEMMEKAIELIKITMDDAINGCVASRKMILDRLLPTKKAVDAAASKDKGDIYISVGVKPKETVEINGEVIENGTK